MSDREPHRYDEADVTTAIDLAVRPRDAEPIYYAVSGSHLYGFPSDDGDVDVRGFHLVDGAEYLKLREPREQFVVNQDGTTEGFEAYAHVDLVSYELKKFAQLLYTANYNVMEVVFCGDEVTNEAPLELRSLRALVRDELPLNVPETYHGMSKSNYKKFLDPDSRRYEPTAKRFLYVLRGLLASEYTRREADIEANVRTLAAWWGDDELSALIDELIQSKLSAESVRTNGELVVEADEWITTLFDEVEPSTSVGRSRYEERLNDWMLEVRRRT